MSAQGIDDDLLLFRPTRALPDTGPRTQAQQHPAAEKHSDEQVSSGRLRVIMSRNPTEQFRCDGEILGEADE